MANAFERGEAIELDQWAPDSEGTARPACSNGANKIPLTPSVLGDRERAECNGEQIRPHLTASDFASEAQSRKRWFRSLFTFSCPRKE